MPSVKELSQKNKYYIPKERYLELIYYCRQYHQWKQEIDNMYDVKSNSFIKLGDSGKYEPYDPTEEDALKLYDLTQKTQLIFDALRGIEEPLKSFVFRGVVEPLSFETLVKQFDIPCSKEVYYRERRKFFFALDGLKK